MAFGGTRTFHRLAKAMETVGFTDIHYEAWNYASGFPKNYNVSRAMATEQAKWDGWGTAMKPAWEPVLIGTKPCE